MPIREMEIQTRTVKVKTWVKTISERDQEETNIWLALVRD
jgi:hypothetical protein